MEMIAEIHATTDYFQSMLDTFSSWMEEVHKVVFALLLIILYVHA